jgi:2-dehydro-3-deoxygluconokinase
MLGEDEGKILLGTDNPADIVRLLRESGASYIAVKRGALGAVVANREVLVEIPAVKTAVVDTVGAGDAFNTGFLCGILEGMDIRACGEAGALLGALTVSVRGDIEGIPNRGQFENLRNQSTVIFR